MSFIDVTNKLAALSHQLPYTTTDAIAWSLIVINLIFFCIMIESFFQRKKHNEPH